MSNDIALRRMERGGVTLTSTGQLIAELTGKWSTPEGGQLVTALQAQRKADDRRLDYPSLPLDRSGGLLVTS
ncbi:MAG: hypothetical protein ACJ8E5_09100 [Xanthobacteraceae bacterium]